MAKFPRVQPILLKVLRDSTDLTGVTCASWIPDTNHRSFPLVNVLRVNGGRDPERPKQLGWAVVDMNAYSTEGLVEAETLYDNALEALYDAVDLQTLTPTGYLHSILEIKGASDLESQFKDSWRVQGLIKFGIRPLRTS